MFKRNFKGKRQPGKCSELMVPTTGSIYYICNYPLFVHVFYTSASAAPNDFFLRQHHPRPLKNVILKFSFEGCNGKYVSYTFDRLWGNLKNVILHFSRPENVQNILQFSSCLFSRHVVLLVLFLALLVFLCSVLFLVFRALSRVFRGVCSCAISCYISLFSCSFWFSLVFRDLVLFLRLFLVSFFMFHVFFAVLFRFLSRVFPVPVLRPSRAWFLSRIAMFSFAWRIYQSICNVRHANYIFWKFATKNSKM